MTSMSTRTVPYAGLPSPSELASPEPHRWRGRRRMEPYLMIAPVVILFLGLIGVPIVILVRYSLLNNVIFVKQSTFVGAANYTSILGSEEFWSAVEHTLIFTAACVVGQLVLGLAFADTAEREKTWKSGQGSLPGDLYFAVDVHGGHCGVAMAASVRP